MIVAEEDALSDESEINNMPGGITYMKSGRVNAIKRLGGLRPFSQSIEDIQFIQSQIERTVRNYDTNQGRETSKVTTASGLAQIRADQQQQSNMKNYDRMQGTDYYYSFRTQIYIKINKMKWKLLKEWLHLLNHLEQ